MDTTPNIAPTAPEKPVVEAAPAAKACPKKKGCGAIILALILLVLVGVGASVYFYLDGNTKAQEITKLKNTIANNNKTSTSVITKEEVKTILDPFITGNNMYNYGDAWNGFNEDMKVSFVFQNLPMSAAYVDQEGVINIQYFEANNLYKRLFGGEKDFPKTNLSYVEYDAENDRFYLHTGGRGGSAHYVINRIKDYTLDGEKLEVELYHDVLTFCSPSSETKYYCDIKNKPADTEEDYPWLPEFKNDEEAERFVEEYKANIPVLKFTFEKNSDDYYDIEKGDLGRFVLKNIVKQ